jgi:hypothetical protein
LQAPVCKTSVAATAEIAKKRASELKTGLKNRIVFIVIVTGVGFKN